MGWQDRDYARPAVRRWGIHPGSILRGRSVVSTLIAINVALYVFGTLSRTLENYIYGFGVLQAEAVFQGQIWRLLTAQYLHANTFHLLLNMLGLHFLGRPLEQMWSPRRFLGIYTACGLAGNVFYTLLAAKGVIHPFQIAVGASGCIYGLLGIAAVIFPHATVFVYFLVPIKIRTAAVIFGGIAIFSILQRGQNYGGEACHLAGLVFGVWWAMKGQAWWDRSEWRWKPRRGAPVRRPMTFQQRRAEEESDGHLVDDILKKVHNGGIASLSERERRLLTEATDRQRRRDESAGW